MFTPRLDQYELIRQKAIDYSMLPIEDMVFPYLMPVTRGELSRRTSYGYVSAHLSISPLLGAPSFPKWISKKELLVEYHTDFRALSDGRTTQTRLGRYLTSIGLSSSIAEQEVNRVKSVSATVDVEFAITSDEIADVYLKGPNSCMMGDKGMFSLCDSNGKYQYFSVPSLYAYPYDRTDIIPSSGNSIAVAYSKSGDSYKSRAMVCMTSMKFSRIYGDIAPLLSGLTKMGFSQKKDMMVGVPLSVKRTSNGYYLCPYIDVKASFAVGVTVDGDKMYLDRNGAWEFGTTKVLTRR